MPLAVVDGIELDPECWGDRHWRLSNLYYITDTAGRKIKFVPNDAQNQLLDDLWYLNIILKSRQRGFSTFIDIMGLDLAVWVPNQTVGIIAHGLFEATNIFSSKVKFPYDNLPVAVRECNPTTLDNRQELKLQNGSWVYVSTSMRSATVQYLHVSEFGKISRRTPSKAREIVNGSFNAVHQGNMIFVESTAEGRDGYFFNMCEEAQKKAAAKARLTPLDFRFHFYPWYTDKNNRLADQDVEGVTVGVKSKKYFDDLEKQLLVKIEPGQRAWYVKKESQLREGREGGKATGNGMKSEFPSTAKEAFQAAVHGAIYGEEMERARNEGRITKVPYVRSVPVYTFWDLGLSKRSGTTALWCMQTVGMQHRFLKCFEDHGKALDHYVRWLLETGYMFGGHYLPHDAGVRRLGTVKVDSWKEMLEGLMPAHQFKLVPVISALSIGIDQTKAKFDACVFDAEGCEDGIRALENYQYEWDPDREAYQTDPLHDWSSNYADSFRQFGQASMVKVGGRDMPPLRPMDPLDRGLGM